MFPQPRVELDGSERLISGYRLTETDTFSPEPVARQSDDELEYCDADLKLTVSLAPAGALDRQREPVSQGIPR